jgi:hypothetical protein
MSHLESGFCVTDIEALAQIVKENCPTLELVRQATYRTWATDHGTLAGDYPLPAVYQLKMLGWMVTQNHKVFDLAQEAGVLLPKDLRKLETEPWTLEMQNKLLKVPEFRQAYQHVCSKVIGNDAEFVIKPKDDQPEIGYAYQIGVVPHPWRAGEYQLMCDFYAQGKGLLLAKGVGQHKEVDGTNSWGGELKQAYAVRAAERAIVTQMRAGNPEYGGYNKTVLPDGRIKLEVFPR